MVFQQGMILFCSELNILPGLKVFICLKAFKW